MSITRPAINNHHQSIYSANQPTNQHTSSTKMINPVVCLIGFPTANSTAMMDCSSLNSSAIVVDITQSLMNTVHALLAIQWDHSLLLWLHLLLCHSRTILLVLFFFALVAQIVRQLVCKRITRKDDANFTVTINEWYTCKKVTFALSCSKID